MEQLSIGEFARMSGLTPKALRLYDELDLVAPERVDPFNGYRWYAHEQLDQARLVARLRLIGMPRPDRPQRLAARPGRPPGPAGRPYHFGTTVTAALIEEGRLTEEEAHTHEDRSLLNRAILPAGSRGQAGNSPDIATTQLRPGDRLFLTGDGIHAVLHPAHLSSLLVDEGDPDAVGQDIADAVETAGAPDNGALVVIDLAEPGSAELDLAEQDLAERATTQPSRGSSPR